MAVLSFRNFTGLTDGERDLILAWRNTDRVRLRMTNRDLLSREEHFRFIDSLASRADRAYYLFSVDGEPAGVLDFVRIDAVSRSCEPATSASWDTVSRFTTVRLRTPLMISGALW